MPNDDADRRGPAHSDQRRRALLVVVIVVAVVLFDQLTKTWAVASLADGPVSIIGTDVELALSRNTGGAFSLFQGMTPVLAVLAIVLVVFLVRAARRTERIVAVLALALVLGGAIGNLGDRVFRSPGFLRGAVVDFVRVGTFPTFNVADSAITVGAILLVGWSLFGGGRDRPEAAPS
ncbi:MAG: signal peptidase II [Acidimicrobiia bacterium]|nr:signal peptidase II [Acidimicrobiia bacterium]